MGEVKNMFDLSKLHLEDELNEDVSFEEGLAEYVKNTKDASVDTLAEVQIVCRSGKRWSRCRYYNTIDRVNDSWSVDYRRKIQRSVLQGFERFNV